MSKIEWTDETWNPIVGCSRVSEGCRNCYAERMAHRLASNPKTPQYAGTTRGTNKGPRWTGQVNQVPEALPKPLSWRKPRRVFVNSMSDLFHPGVPFEYIAAVFGVMAVAPEHTFQVLTKRPGRVLEFFAWLEELRERVKLSSRAANCWMWTIEMMDRAGMPEAAGLCEEFWLGHTPWPLPNVWLGVSVEDQTAADERIPLLLECPAAVRFLSCEPLLGPVDLTRVLWPGGDYCNALTVGNIAYSEGPIDWVIAGGESGPGARPMHPDWARGLRDQCAAAGVPYLFKQHGAWLPVDHADPGIKYSEERNVWRDEPSEDDPPLLMFRVGKKAAGRILDGQTHDEFPEAR